jgi:hypothetical protein
VRFKPLPAPPSRVEDVASAGRALPLVPGPEDESVARLERRLDLPSRDVARRWLTLLRALGLVERTPSGFRRRPVDPTPESLRSAFRDRVFHAEAVLSALSAADAPLPVAAAFAAVRDDVPTWERHKNPGTWEDVWRERTRRLLEWLVVLGLAEETPAGFVRVEAE